MVGQVRWRLVAFSIILIVIAALVWAHFEREHSGLEYVYDESVFHDFLIDDSGYVTFICDITIRNRSNTEMKFSMTADVSKDIGLTKEKFAHAFEGDTHNDEIFDIEANSKQSYKVKFKALSGDKKTKMDRLPLEEVILTPL